MANATYVLITAAYNEERLIENTLNSVVSQTLLPQRWIIVSDGSTDRTDDIVRSYSETYPFIELHRITEQHARDFGAQVNAINTGYQRLKHLDFNFVANLDADISFGPNYYATLIKRISADPRLGLVGGSIFEDHGHGFQRRLSNSIHSVAHAVQLFRRECFDAIGGYIPLKYGGPDWVAEVQVRRLGWRVHSFPDLVVLHHRPAASAGGFVRGWYRQGLMDYSLGSIPLFEVIKCARRLREHPLVIGALARWTGFCMSALRRSPRLVDEQFIDYLRREQRERLRAIFRLKPLSPAERPADANRTTSVPNAIKTASAPGAMVNTSHP